MRKNKMRKKLRKLRLDKGLTVDEIAGEFNISSSYYYKIEAGTRNPTMNLAKRIADFFNKEIEELFFSEEMDETSKTNDQTA